MKLSKNLFIAGAAVLLLIQFIPYGKNHENPSVKLEPLWDSPATRAIAKRACFNCHSHETVWPWYAKIAPASWLVYYDVVKARKDLDFSDWQKGKRKGENADRMAQEVNSGDMPPFRYVIAHSEAKLSAVDKKQLSSGLQATYYNSVK